MPVTRFAMPRLILIDLDGTLVDSVPDLAWAVDRMQERLGLPTHGEDKVREWVGNGAPRLVERALSGTLDGKPDAALFERGYPVFMELYAEHVCVASRPYPGVVAGLDRLRETDAHLACVTNKPERFTLPVLEELGLMPYFELVISGDTLPAKKPDPLPLLHAAEHFGVAPTDSLLVGDSINDVQAAREARFAVVCVSYGYNHGQDIRLAEPDAVIDSLAELPELLAEPA